MLDAIGEAGVHRFAAEVEIGLARVAHRPATHLVAEIEQAGLVRDRRIGLGRNQPTRRCGRDRRLLVAGALTQEAAWADRNDSRHVGARRGLLCRSCGCRRALRRCGGRGRGWRGRGSLGHRGGGLGCRRLGRCSRCGRGSRFLLRRRLGLACRGLLFRGFDRGRARFQPQAVRLADHRIARNLAQFLGDLGRGRAAFPHALEGRGALFSPTHRKSICFVPRQAT